MRKGLTGALQTIIDVAILVLVIFAVYVTISASGVIGYAASSVSTGASAEDLAAAVNWASRCIDENGDGAVECMEGREVKISVPQDLYGGDPSTGKDPMWIIYHDRKLDSGNVNSGVPPTCENEQWWDLGPSVDQCLDSICWGLIESTDKGRTMVDEEALQRLEDFYIIDPCYAVIKVRDDGSGSIEICYEERLDGSGEHNYCYTENSEGCNPLGIIGFDGHAWPDKDGVWGDYPNLQDTPQLKAC